MPIPENQLIAWSNQGAVETAKATHEAIRTCLEGLSSKIYGRAFTIFLQGSYRSDTNIRGDSDVDVIVQLDEMFFYDLSSLPPLEKFAVQSGITPSNLSLGQFRNDVEESLRGYFDTKNVASKERAIKLGPTSGRIPADIVSCAPYRRYLQIPTPQNPGFVQGIMFFAVPSGRAVVNYPKQHFKNGASKNALLRTRGNYKPIIRMFKNARCEAVDRKLLGSDSAPSYFIECLLYNVAEALFTESFQESYFKIVEWLSQASLSSFMCRNGEILLFGNTPEQWTETKAREFIQALIDLWNQW